MKRLVVIILVGIGIVVVTTVLIMASKNKNRNNVTTNNIIEPAKPVVQDSFIKEADNLVLKGDLSEASKLYKKEMEKTQDLNTMREIQKKIEEINMKMLFSSRVDENSIEYVVKPNDALEKIAKQFNTTVAAIKRSNGLKSDIIQLNQKLKVNNCKFSISVDKSQNILLLKRGDEVVKTYIVSTGSNNSTPIGSYKIINKLENPTWFKSGAVIAPDSPDNVLGTRWLGFNLKGFGIHGTTEPENLGKQVTLGCVRMKNEEVDELYDIVPVGTEVIIVD